jgi:hypothetical protein
VAFVVAVDGTVVVSSVSLPDVRRTRRTPATIKAITAATRTNTSTRCIEPYHGRETGLKVSVFEGGGPSRRSVRW